MGNLICSTPLTLDGVITEKGEKPMGQKPNFSAHPLDS
jgi:hypothetical protein